MKITKKNILIERGDAYLDEDRLEIRIPGDWTTSKCSWGVKENKIASGDLLICKKNTLAGGNNSQLELVLEGEDTIFKISLLKEDTQDFKKPKYDYDLVAVNPIDLTNTKTIANGDFKLNFDVQSDLNGIDLPETAERLIPVLASNFENGQFIQVLEATPGNKKFQGSYYVFGMMLIDTDGNLTIDDHIELDNNLTIDESGDITLID
jgi:hypothetical protein